MPTIPPPQYGDIQGGSDAKGVMMWLAIYYPPSWFLWWTVGHGYLAPMIRYDIPPDGCFKWRNWT